jgi:preprotein translocase subunit SecD
MKRPDKVATASRRLAVFVTLVLGVTAAVLGFGLRPKLGLDLQGGLSITYQAKGGLGPDSVDKAVDIIRNRVDALGVAEPEIARQGADLIQVQIPGISDPEMAERVIGKTAKLAFRPVLGVVTETAVPESGAVTDSATTFPRTTPAEEDLPDREVQFALKDRPQVVLKLGPVELTGDQVKRADATLQNLEWVVLLEFTPEGASKFKSLTGRLACFPKDDPKRQLAIVLDQVIESAPTMSDDVRCNEGISDRAVITVGEGGEKAAKELALVLRFGALPVELVQLSKEQVSPTIGHDALVAGLIAGALGLLLVLAYVLVYYRGLALVIVAGLAIFAALNLAIVSFLGSVAHLALTLAGVAGLIVSVGITADSYIVFFERIKDEIREGRAIRPAVEAGFRRAFRTILAADTVSFLAAALLWFLAVGSVKGFAFFLGIATITDVLIAYFFTQNFVMVLTRTRALTSGILSIERIALPPTERIRAEGVPASASGGGK